MQQIAIGLAVVALLTAGIAAIVVVNRGNGEHAGRTAVEDRRVAASDVVKLGPATIEIVSEGGLARGARIKDRELARALSIEPDDLITGISGRQIRLESDFHDVMFNTSLMHVTSLYVELERDHKPVLARWKVDGDLRKARLAATAATLPPFPSYPSYPSPDPLAPDPDDALLATIVKIDDLHYQVPRKTIDAVLANPTAIARGARIVPSVQNGVAAGLQALRDSAKLDLFEGRATKRRHDPLGQQLRGDHSGQGARCIHGAQDGERNHDRADSPRSAGDPRDHDQVAGIATRLSDALDTEHMYL